MRRSFFHFFLFVLVAQSFTCNPARHTQSVAPATASTREIISYLASDALEGRATGSDGERKAAAYIVQQFEAAGLQPHGTDHTWYQSFSFKPHPAAQMHQVGDSLKMGMALVQEITGRNVIGFLDNHKPYTIIIGAHYDHLGWGDENSLWSGPKAIHNGADDNASGVAALITLSRLVQQEKTPGYNYLFIAFSGEEKGLWGSNYFCKNPTIPLESVNCMLNMDMVGRLNVEHTLAVNGVGTSPTWNKILPGIMPSDIKQVTSESGVGPSDHTSFYNMNIPVLHFFTGQHDDYHKPTDDADKVNYEGEDLVIRFIHELTDQLAAIPKLEFARTKDDSTTKAADFKVTLGVVPDYLYDGEGMRIDGVREGRPASKAGMKQGDVVLQIGDVVVKDMTSYMEALGKFDKGQSTIVKIKRGEEFMDIPVTWE